MTPKINTPLAQNFWYLHALSLYNIKDILLFLSYPILVSFSKPQQKVNTTTVQEPTNLAALDRQLYDLVLLEPDPTEEDEFLIWNMRREALESEIALVRAKLLSISASQEGQGNSHAKVNCEDGYYDDEGCLSDCMAPITLEKSTVNEAKQPAVGYACIYAAPLVVIFFDIYGEKAHKRISTGLHLG